MTESILHRTVEQKQCKSVKGVATYRIFETALASTAVALQRYQDQAEGHQREGGCHGPICRRGLRCDWKIICLDSPEDVCHER